MLRLHLCSSSQVCWRKSWGSAHRLLQACLFTALCTLILCDYLLTADGLLSVLGDPTSACLSAVKIGVSAFFWSLWDNPFLICLRHDLCCLSSLCSYSWIPDPPVSGSPAVGSQAYATRPASSSGFSWALVQSICCSLSTLVYFFLLMVSVELVTLKLIQVYFPVTLLDSKGMLSIFVF